LSSDTSDESNNNARKNLAIAAMPQNMNAGGNTDIPPRTTPATIKQLKDECKSHNLKVSGTKPQLLERLRVFKLGEKDDGGRGDDEPVTKWTGRTAKQLKEECKKHDIPVGGNKVALLEQLSQFKEMKSQIARETIPMRDLSEQDLVALQEMEELKHEIECQKEDLVEYRSHMARHLSEDVSAANKLETFKDDKAIVASDYKMKILSCFFRENQKKWFGKRGTLLLGFMLTTNLSDKESKAKGLKEVTW
jgi:DNA-binding Xre family transcriptional regulator